MSHKSLLEVPRLAGFNALSVEIVQSNGCGWIAGCLKESSNIIESAETPQEKQALIMGLVSKAKVAQQDAAKQHVQVFGPLCHLRDQFECKGRQPTSEEAARNLAKLGYKTPTAFLKAVAQQMGLTTVHVRDLLDATYFYGHLFMVREDERPAFPAPEAAACAWRYLKEADGDDGLLQERFEHILSQMWDLQLSGGKFTKRHAKELKSVQDAASGEEPAAHGGAVASAADAAKVPAAADAAAAAAAKVPSAADAAAAAKVPAAADASAAAEGRQAPIENKASSVAAAGISSGDEAKTRDAGIGRGMAETRPTCSSGSRTATSSKSTNAAAAKPTSDSGSSGKGNCSKASEAVVMVSEASSKQVRPFPYIDLIRQHPLLAITSMLFIVEDSVFPTFSSDKGAVCLTLLLMVIAATMPIADVIYTSRSAQVERPEGSDLVRDVPIAFPKFLPKYVPERFKECIMDQFGRLLACPGDLGGACPIHYAIVWALRREMGWREHRYRLQCLEACLLKGGSFSTLCKSGDFVKDFEDYLFLLAKDDASALWAKFEEKFLDEIKKAS